MPQPQNRKLIRGIGFALLAGLAIRIVFVLHFPATDDDSAAYIELAHNLVDHHTYGLYLNGVLTPVTFRMPGYPLFLATIYALGGKSLIAIRMAQVAIDLGTCLLVSLLAWTIAPEGQKRGAAIAGAWLGALCPFVANYTAVVLTEVLATFWTAAAVVAIVWGLGASAPGAVAARVRSPRSWWFASGACAGMGALMRPETPILLLAAGVALVWRWWRPRDWVNLLTASALSAAGLFTALVPWTVRNWITLHEFEPLVPRYVHLPGEQMTPGFIEWSKTWLVRYSELDGILYKVGREPINFEDIPARAFDSARERAQSACLIEQQHSDLAISPSLDTEFGKLARERKERHPFRTYLWIPFRRIGTIWFTPRVELLPYSADLWPPRERLPDDPKEFSVSLALWLIAVGILIAAFEGWWSGRRSPAFVFIAAFVIVRTVFFAAVHFTPEPRFVLECFPPILGCASLAIAIGLRRRAKVSAHPQKT